MGGRKTDTKKTRNGEEIESKKKFSAMTVRTKMGEGRGNRRREEMCGWCIEERTEVAEKHETREPKI